jgi:hypothetical protein
MVAIFQPRWQRDTVDDAFGSFTKYLSVAHLNNPGLSIFQAVVQLFIWQVTEFLSIFHILWHIRRDLTSVGNNVMMTTVVVVGCEEPRAWKGLMVFRAL